MQFIYNYNDQGGMVMDVSIFFLLPNDKLSSHIIVIIFNNICNDDIIMFI